MANTSTLTALQLDTAATATMTIAQPAKPTTTWTGCRVTFYQADAAAGALANKLVCDVYDPVSGVMKTFAADDPTIFATAEIAGIPTMLKRAVVEARRVAGSV